jgi:hypothetical protein
MARISISTKTPLPVRRRLRLNHAKPDARTESIYFSVSPTPLKISSKRIS